MPEFTSDWFSKRIPTWHKLLAGLKGLPVRCLEIGSYEGRSALWTLENICTHPDSTITCIDIWPNPEIEQRFMNNLLAPAGKISKWKGPSWKVLRELPIEYFDFAYIDGSHEGYNVLEDAVAAFRLVKRGGLICFDDYKWEGPKRFHLPKPAIDAFLQLSGTDVELLEKEYQVWVRKSGEPGK